MLQPEEELASKEVTQYEHILTFYVYIYILSYFDPGISQETHSLVNPLSDVPQFTSVPIGHQHALFELCKANVGNGWKWMEMVKYPMQTIANSSLNTILSMGRFCQLEKFKLPNTNHVALQQHQQQAWFQKVYTPDCTAGPGPQGPRGSDDRSQLSFLDFLLMRSRVKG